jgi:hypothetical protein
MQISALVLSAMATLGRSERVPANDVLADAITAAVDADTEFCR